MSRDSKKDDYIYQALNYYKLDEDIDINEIEEVDEVTSKRIKKLINNKTKKNRPKYKKVGAIAIGLFLVANIVIVSSGGVEAYANIGKSIMSSIANIIGDREEYDKYRNRIDASVTDKGITFVVNEIVSDGNRLVMSYSIISDGNLKDKVKNFDNIGHWPRINGKDFTGLTREGKMVSENRYDGCDFINDVNGIIPKGDFYLDILMKDIGELKGNWDIRVKVNSDKIKKDVNEYKVNKKVNIGVNDNFTITKIITSPLSVGIKAKGSYGKYHYILLDDKGNELDWKGTYTDDGNIAMDYSGLISKDTKSLIFIPCKEKENYKPKYDMHSLDKLPIKIDQGKYGSITVNKAEWIEDNRLKISYEIDSKYPLDLSYAFSLFDSNNKEKDADNLSNTQVSRGDLKNFEMVFSGLDKKETYKIGSRRMDEHHIIEEDKQFTIELKK